MNDLVSVRDLRNKGGAVIDAVARGSAVTITRDGVPVAELRPLPHPPPTARELIRRRRTLPGVDPAGLRSDLDALLDPSL
jgi:prevent-host-death family protein